MIRTLCVRSANDKTFSYIHKIDSEPKFIEFNPHAHIGVEIYIFIKGDVESVIEGRTYRLSPYDVLIMNENELHQIHPNNNSDYERVVINISPDFFSRYGVEEYKAIFSKKSPSDGNLIKGFIAQSAGLYTSIMRIERYIGESGRRNDMIVRCMIIELLHILSRISVNPSGFDSQNKTVSEIIAYINQNISQPLSLDLLAQRFFLSKYHLCRIFRQYSGFTPGSYITNKRIMLVRSYCREGMNISEAAAAAGFGNYSNFYRIYVAQTGHSPKTDLKRS